VNGRFLDVDQRKVWLLENGRGAPLLYLHGFVDVHSVKESWMPFHDRLAATTRVIAPAHPGCSQSDENNEIEAVEDVVFHYLEFLDALNIPQFDLVGSCVGGEQHQARAGKNNPGEIHCAFFRPLLGAPPISVRSCWH